MADISHTLSIFQPKLLQCFVVVAADSHCATRCTNVIYPIQSCAEHSTDCQMQEKYIGTVWWLGCPCLEALHNSNKNRKCTFLAQYPKSIAQFGREFAAKIGSNCAGTDAHGAQKKTNSLTTFFWDRQKQTKRPTQGVDALQHHPAKLLDAVFRILPKTFLFSWNASFTKELKMPNYRRTGDYETALFCRKNLEKVKNHRFCAIKRTWKDLKERKHNWYAWTFKKFNAVAPRERQGKLQSAKDFSCLLLTEVRN